MMKPITVDAIPTHGAHSRRMISEIHNDIALRREQLRELEDELEEFRRLCPHDWMAEEGYLFTGFYCRRCGSTK